MRGFRFLDPAIFELEDAAAYYANKSVELSRDFQIEINRALQHLRQFPMAAPKVNAKHRSYKLPRFPYVLIYRVMETELVVAAVAHCSRRPGYWRGREPEV